MIGKLFNSIGMLPSDHFIEVDKSGLVAQYVGQTSPKVNGVVDRALGGVLFIDEAYTLTNDGQGGGFGQEAIDTLMKRMEDDRGKFVVIAAGYKKDMERFLKSNSGLPSRFTRKFHFEDYNAGELEQIFMIIASSQGYKLAENAKPLLTTACRKMYDNRDENFGNGRDIRNLFDSILLNQSVRLSRVGEISDNSLYSIIEASDFPVEEKKEDSLEAALARLDKLTGLASVKKEVRELINFLKIEKLRNDGEGSSRIGGHYIFTGNPGTGKTTVARILSDIFKNMGMLSKGHLVEKDRSGLVGQYIGETAQKTTAAIDEAMGGVFFVDEAYALIPEEGGKDFGKEAVDTILKRMEDDKGKFIVIAAGYKNEMKRFLNSNPGLPSRFQNTIEFEDYTPEELIFIFKGMTASKKMIMTPEFESKLVSELTGLYTNRDDNFANGRTVRNLFEAAQKRQSSRVAGIPSLKAGDPELFTFEAEDLV
jgi:SpoVK/Ycf46/Vps4 family AAA+-type ATPase